MQEELLELICCPACRGRITVQVLEEDEVEWLAGQLTCEKCGEHYRLKDGMPFLYLDDERWTSKALEADGWVKIHKSQGIYDQLEEVDPQLPYLPMEPWISVAKSFDLARDKLQLNGNESILDLGAGRGWAAKQFAVSGNRVVALDVTPDTFVGLGRSRALMDMANVYFERIIGDGENLPFQKNQFDVVFCAGALHHFSDLPLLFQNIYTVLKPGGRLCAINEPCIGIAFREANILADDASEELGFGINETRPNLIKYVSALETAGLELSEVLLMGVNDLNEAELAGWKRHMGVSVPPIYLRQPINTAMAWKKYAMQRGYALRNGELLKTRSFTANARKVGFDVDGLIWCGGELFLIARKPDNSPQRRLLPG